MHLPGLEEKKQGQFKFCKNLKSRKTPPLKKTDKKILTITFFCLDAVSFFSTSLESIPAKKFICIQTGSRFKGGIAASEQKSNFCSKCFGRRRKKICIHVCKSFRQIRHVRSLLRNYGPTLEQARLFSEI